MGAKGLNNYVEDRVVIYKGKAKDMTFKALSYRVFWELAKPIEKLEPKDFPKN